MEHILINKNVLKEKLQLIPNLENIIILGNGE